MVFLMSIISLSTFKIIQGMYTSTVSSTQKTLQANEAQLVSEYANYYVENAACYGPALPPGNECLTAGSDDLVFSGTAQDLQFYGLNEFCPGYTNTYSQYHFYLNHTGNYGPTNVYDLMLTTSSTSGFCPSYTQDIASDIVDFSFNYYDPSGNCVSGIDGLINDPPSHSGSSLGPIDNVFQVSISAVFQASASAQQVSYSTCIFLPNSQSVSA